MTCTRRSAEHLKEVAEDSLCGMVQIMKLKAVVHNAEEGGYWAEVPALPGCITQGESLEELRLNIKEAIELWLEAGDDQVVATEYDQIMEMAV